MLLPASLLLIAFLLLMASARVGGPAVALVPTVACATAVVGDHAIDVILAVAFVTLLLAWANF
jgi:hypothetical protein